MLSYSPANQAFDGSFRTHRGEGPSSRRAGLRAQGLSRAACRHPPRRCLTTKPPRSRRSTASACRTRFRSRAPRYSFPDPRRPGLSPLLVRVEDGSAHLQAGQRRSAPTPPRPWSSCASNDDAGRVVHKTSQEYQLTGTLEELDGAKRGEILFYREAELPPGVYSVEAVVFDAAGKRASARVATLEVPRVSQEQAQVSSLVLVDRIEQTAADDAAASAMPMPRVTARCRPRPALRRQSSRVSERWRANQQARSPRADVLLQHLRRHGAEARRRDGGAGTARQRPPARARAVAADRAGRASAIQQVSRIPIDSLTPGAYELRVRVHDGTRVIERSAFLRLVE